MNARLRNHTCKIEKTENTEKTEETEEIEETEETEKIGKTEKTKQQTALQRRVIIIIITDRDKDVNLSQALRDAIIKRQDLSFDIKNYSSFDLERSN